MADSIREALTKAIAETETPAEPPVPAGTIEGSATPETPAPVVTEGGDESKTDPGAEAPASPPASDPSKAPPKAALGTPAAATPGSDNGSPSPSTNDAPASWKLSERTHWAAIPKEAQEAIRRRETEMRRAISASQEASSFKKNFDTALDRFQPLLKERGVSDVVGQVVAPLMQIRAGLEVGNPQQKAMLVSTIVRDFGIDIGILDQCLTQLAQSGNLGRPAAPQPPAFNPQAVPELAPLFAIAERMKTAERDKAAKAIEAVQALPHYEEVRNTMADLLEKAQALGKEIPLERLYDHAAELHGFEPRVRQTVSTSDAAAILARSRRAASSVSGAPQTSPGKKPASLREQIAAAMHS